MGDQGQLPAWGEDALVTTILARAAETGHYAGIMAELRPADRAAVEAAMDRHAARRRAAGEPGW